MAMSLLRRISSPLTRPGAPPTPSFPQAIARALHSTLPAQRRAELSSKFGRCPTGRWQRKKSGTRLHTSLGVGTSLLLFLRGFAPSPSPDSLLPVDCTGGSAIEPPAMKWGGEEDPRRNGGCFCGGRGGFSFTPCPSPSPCLYCDCIANSTRGSLRRTFITAVGRHSPRVFCKSWPVGDN